jgi:hypothetical protein
MIFLPAGADLITVTISIDTPIVLVIPSLGNQSYFLAMLKLAIGKQLIVRQQFLAVATT